jgi:hemerythrin superfamily protein
MKSQPKIDAIELLIQDHKEVKKLFEEFDALTDRSKAKKKVIADKICHELIIHTQIEEEIFYPKVREAIKDSDLMDEALVEHAGAKDLIAQILDMSPGEDLYDAKVTVLSEQIDHHVKEEEEDMFPKVRKSGLDLIVLGEQMLARKNEIKNAEVVA